jgi:hypothetical protein
VTIGAGRAADIDAVRERDDRRLALHHDLTAEHVGVEPPRPLDAWTTTKWVGTGDAWRLPARPELGVGRQARVERMGPIRTRAAWC